MKKMQHGSRDPGKRERRVAVAKSVAKRLLTQDEVRLNRFERRWFNSATEDNRNAMMKSLKLRVQDELPENYVIKVVPNYPSPYLGVLKSFVITRRVT